MFNFYVPFFSLISFVDDLLNLVFHEVVVSVFGDLNNKKSTKTKKKPAASQISESTSKT